MEKCNFRQPAADFVLGRLKRISYFTTSCGPLKGSEPAGATSTLMTIKNCCWKTTQVHSFWVGKGEGEIVVSLLLCKVRMELWDSCEIIV